jgi:integrase
MASISRDPGGTRRILFVARDGSRKTIRLGKVNQKTAETVKIRVEAIASSQILGQPLDRETSSWLAALGDDIYAKLVNVGLVQPRHQGTTVNFTVGEFIEQFIVSRSDVKPGTVIAYEQARNKALEFFGADKPLADITALDADRFRAWMKGVKELGENTIRGQVKNIKQFFQAAVKGRIIAENPFAGHKTTVFARPERMAYIDREAIQRVLTACPSLRWQAIVVLSRFGGLRCPSEVFALKWEHIDFERGRMRVYSPKMEGPESGSSREVPLFPEVPEVLEGMFLLPDGGEYIVTDQHQGPQTNLRTTFEKIIRKAGLEPWGKPFQNLRSSRETELAREWPIHVVTAWRGTRHRWP